MSENDEHEEDSNQDTVGVGTLSDTETDWDASLSDEKGRKIPVLTIITSNGGMKELEIKKHQFYMGRSTDCDLQVVRPNASRFHAFITYENLNSQTDDPVCLIEDNESRNGTWLNGSRLKKPRKLSHGDRLMIGNMVINYLVRQEWELESNRRIIDVMNRYGGPNSQSRIACNFDATLKILIPDETFTPQSVSGKVRDIDFSGVRLVSTEMTSEFWLKTIQKKRTLKSEITFDSLGLTCKGRMAWSHMDVHENEPACIMGFEFTNVTNSSKKKLRDALKSEGILIPDED